MYRQVPLLITEFLPALLKAPRIRPVTQTIITYLQHLVALLLLLQTSSKNNKRNKQESSGATISKLDKQK